MFQVFTAIHFMGVALAGWLTEQHQALIDYLIEENRVLREQLGQRRLRFSDAQRRRLAVRARALGRAVLEELETLVTADTLLRWHRELIARKWTHPRRGPGRPPVPAEVADLVLRMAKENSGWGYDRIAGALGNLGHTISPTTVRNILKRHGVEPAPERRKHTSWSEFLRTHWELLWATDFFTDAARPHDSLRAVCHSPVLAAGSVSGDYHPSRRRLHDSGRAPAERSV